MNAAIPKRRPLPGDELTEQEERALWQSYVAHRDSGIRERLIDNYLPYARIIAAKLYAGRHHDEFEFNEYAQFAIIGLMESIDRFEPDRGAQFKTYASQRMIGAILDGIEMLSEKQQQISFRQRLMAERTKSLKQDKKPDTTVPDQLFSYLADVGLGLALGYLLEGSGMIELEERGSAASQYDRLEMMQMRQQIQRLLNTLPDREQRVIRYHYLQNIPFQEIAAMCGLTKSRISQVHRNALEMLRKEIKQMKIRDIAW